MFWRIYFWTFAALSILNALSAALRPEALAITDWVDLAVFTPMALFAVWSQAFDKWLPSGGRQAAVAKRLLLLRLLPLFD